MPTFCYRSFVQMIVAVFLSRSDAQNVYGGKGKKCYNFKRKNNVCLSAYITYGSHVRKELLSHPHSKRNERREPEIDFFFFLFVCDFFLFICICTFVCAPFACRLTAATTPAITTINTTTTNANICAEGYMAWPLNVPSFITLSFGAKCLFNSRYVPSMERISRCCKLDID